MPKPQRTPEPEDDNAEIVRAVEEITDSEPVNGEDLLGSEELKKKLREAKIRLVSTPKRKPQ